jgi:hypothetical protein
MPQIIGVPKETAAGEKRVATVPEVVEKLIKLGFKVMVQSGAGDAANCSDDTYRAAGAEIAASAAQLWSGSDIVFKVGVLREGGREGGGVVDVCVRACPEPPAPHSGSKPSLAAPLCFATRPAF